MFARKDIERDALSDYRQYGRQARTHKDLPGGAPSASSEWPRVLVPAEPVETATPEPTPARAPPVEKIVLRGVGPAGPSSKRQTHWASPSAGQSFLLLFIFLFINTLRLGALSTLLPPLLGPVQLGVGRQRALGNHQVLQVCVHAKLGRHWGDGLGRKQQQGVPIRVRHGHEPHHQSDHPGDRRSATGRLAAADRVGVEAGLSGRGVIPMTSTYFFQFLFTKPPGAERGINTIQDLVDTTYGRRLISIV